MFNIRRSSIFRSLLSSTKEIIIEGGDMDKPLYLNWLVEELGVVFEDGKSLNCYKLSYELNDEILDNWSLHLRRHYENDEDLVESACLNNRSVKDYLREMVIPQKEDNFGPTSRSNDISEILFADLFKFILGYEVPRCKQYNRSGKTQSEHGTDILAYKFYSPKKTFHIKDELVAIEVKAGLE